MTSFECTIKAADRHLWSALHVDRPSNGRWHSQVIQVIDTGILRVMSILTQVINTITYVNIDIIHWHQWCHIWHPYWVRLGPNGSLSQNVLKLILKKSQICPPFGANMTQFGCQIRHPWSFVNLALDVIHWRVSARNKQKHCRHNLTV